MIKLELTVEQVNTILAGIGELPTKIGLPLVEAIRKQAEPQLASKPTE